MLTTDKITNTDSGKCSYSGCDEHAVVKLDGVPYCWEHINERFAEIRKQVTKRGFPPPP